MAELTKEWLKQTIAEYEANRDELPFGLDTNSAIELQAFKLALASLEAEPVAYIFKHPAGKLFWALTDESNKDQSDVIPVYAAPPVPVVPAALPENDDEDGHDIDYLEPSEVYSLGRTAGWNACRAAMLQGADGNSPVIAKAYDIEAFGVFSATEGKNGLLLQIEQFWFGTENCPQIGKENMVPKFALQAIINRLQAHCNSMGEDTLIDIFASSAAPQQEDK
ncbi:hypothetical protein ACVEVI_003726 [Escherichia coli]